MNVAPTTEIQPGYAFNVYSRGPSRARPSAASCTILLPPLDRARARRLTVPLPVRSLPILVSLSCHQSADLSGPNAVTPGSRDQYRRTPGALDQKRRQRDRRADDLAVGRGILG